LYLELIISGFQQYSRWVGIAHQIQLNEAFNGGQCPPYAKKFMQPCGLPMVIRSLIRFEKL
jgi:hypothetical protein